MSLRHFDSASSIGKGKSLLIQAFPPSSSTAEDSTISTAKTPRGGEAPSSIFLERKSFMKEDETTNNRHSSSVRLGSKTRSFSSYIPPSLVEQQQQPPLSGRRPPKTSMENIVHESGLPPTPKPTSSTTTTTTTTTVLADFNRPSSLRLPRRASSNVPKADFSPSTLGVPLTISSPSKSAGAGLVRKTSSSPMVKHAFATSGSSNHVPRSPSKLVNQAARSSSHLKSYKSSESISLLNAALNLENASPSKSPRIISFVGGRDRGHPIMSSAVVSGGSDESSPLKEEDPSPIHGPISPANDDILMESPVDVLNTTTASPLVGDQMTTNNNNKNVQIISPILDQQSTLNIVPSKLVLDVAKSSEKRRRKQLIARQSSNDSQLGSQKNNQRSLLKRHSSAESSTTSSTGGGGGGGGNINTSVMVRLNSQTAFDETSTFVPNHNKREEFSTLMNKSLSVRTKRAEIDRSKLSMNNDDKEEDDKDEREKPVMVNPANNNNKTMISFESATSSNTDSSQIKETSFEEAISRLETKEEDEEQASSIQILSNSPGDVGRRVPKQQLASPSGDKSSSQRRRLGRSYRSAPNVIPSSSFSNLVSNSPTKTTTKGILNMPPKSKISARFKPGKSPLAENLTGEITLDTTNLLQQSQANVVLSPNHMRDFFKKTLNDADIKVRMFNRRPSQIEKRKNKQEKILASLDSPKDLRLLCLDDGGLIKSENRKTAWPSLLADAFRRIPKEELLQATDPNSESNLLAPTNDASLRSEEQRKQDHKQIDLDVERKYEESEIEHRQRLRRFLHSYFYAHPDLCYFQGFHDLCAVVLRIFDDDLLAEYVLFKLSTQTVVRDAHRSTMDAVFAQLRAVFYILECADPELADRLKSTVGTDSFWGISMLTCLFAHDVFHIQTLERLLDACIAGSPQFPLYLVASVAQLPRTRHYLMTCDCDETLFLGTLRQDAREIQGQDADELVRFALLLERRVPPARVLDHAYRKLGLPVDSFLASRWLVKSKWMFVGSSFKVRDKALGE